MADTVGTAVGSSSGEPARVHVATYGDQPGRVHVSVWPRYGDDAGATLNLRQAGRLRDHLTAAIAAADA